MRDIYLRVGTSSELVAVVEQLAIIPDVSVDVIGEIPGSSAGFHANVRIDGDGVLPDDIESAVAALGIPVPVTPCRVWL